MRPRAARPCRSRGAAAVLLLAFLAVLPAGASGTHPVFDLRAERLWPGTAVQATASRVDGERLLRDVRTLAAPDMEGRSAGSAGGRRAQALILERFGQLGLQPVGGTFAQEFALDSRHGPGRAANLMAMVPGGAAADDVVLVSAHYDHLGVRGGRLYPGADDNASGVAALLEIARHVAERRPARGVLFVAFDAEEHGLAGARHFVAHPPLPLNRLRVVVNMDMLGRGDSGTLVVAGTSPYPALKPVVEEAARGRAVRVLFGHDRFGPEDWTHASDHGPFHEAGVPFLYFGVQNHPDYHKPTDTAERIPIRFLTEAAEIVLETVQRLANPG